MEDKEKEGETEWELHKSVFCNDLKRLTQILKSLKNKEEKLIDKKVTKCDYNDCACLFLDNYFNVG